MITLLFAFAPRRRSTATATPSPIAVASSSLSSWALITRPWLSWIGRGTSRPLDDIDQCAVIERQRTLAVGESAEGDESDEVIRAARQSARAGAEHEFLNDVLDRFKPADVPAFELEVDGFHRAGNVEHDLDGDPLAGRSAIPPSPLAAEPARRSPGTSPAP